MGEPSLCSGRYQVVRTLHEQAERDCGLPREEGQARWAEGQGREVRACGGGVRREGAEKVVKGQGQGQGQVRRNCPGPNLFDELAQPHEGQGVQRRSEGSALGPDSGTSGVHAVPGASATPVDVLRIWKCLPRWLLCSKTNFAIFLHSFLGNTPLEHEGTARGLWPISAPYPECFMKKGAWGESAEDGGTAACQRRAINLTVLLLSWLHLNRPRRAPKSLSLGSRLTQPQWSVVRRLEAFYADVAESGLIGPNEMGRTAAKVEGLESLLRRLQEQAEAVLGLSYADCAPRRVAAAERNPGYEKEAGEVIGRLEGGVPVLAKLIEPNRLSLPSDYPSFDPTDLFPEPHRQVYRDPISRAKTIDADYDQPPRVRMNATRVNVLGLLEALDSTGRLRLSTLEEIRPSHLCGAFSLVKDLHKDRLIVDARAPNMLEETLDTWCKTLASPLTLAQVELGVGENMYFSGTDLRDYYHAFKVTDARAKRNTFSCPFRPDQVAHLRAYAALTEEQRKAPWLYPSLAALAMGDCQAVELGQLAHIQVALASAALGPEELLVVHGRAPRGHIAAGIVIDDLILAERAPAGRIEPQQLESVCRLHKLCEEYLQRGLAAHPKKTFRGVTKAEFWGCQVDGESGILRANCKRMVPLLVVTVATARLKCATVGLLEVLAGAWVSVLQMRRRMMSLLNHIYVAQRGRERNEIVRFSPQLIDELFALVLLAPLAAVDMRAQSLSEVYMTDASEWGIGIVRSFCPKAFTQEIQRHCLARGAWAKLLSPWQSWLKMHGMLREEAELPDGVPLVSHPLWLVLAQVLQYELVEAKAAGRKEHINLLELKAILALETRLAQRQHSLRYLCGADSQVVLASLVKGRSSSPRLLAALQQSLPVYLGAGLYGNYGYVPSLANPSDDPTRGVSIRSPSREEPSWWASACAGDFGQLDEWLRGLGYDPLSVAQVPLTVGSVDREALVSDLLSELVKVQKPERLAAFRLRREKRLEEACAGSCRQLSVSPGSVDRNDTDVDCSRHVSVSPLADSYKNDQEPDGQIKKAHKRPEPEAREPGVVEALPPALGADTPSSPELPLSCKQRPRNHGWENLRCSPWIREPC